jgi:pimeloyl-ACP methyl ester carboxylesterase
VTAIDEGSGPAIVIVHPGGSDASAWEPVARLLTDEFRVIRIQRRIYAPGASIVLPHSMAVEADDILAIATEVGRPLLVGHSSGGVAALEAVLRSPATFAGLVLYEPPVPSSALVGGEAALRARAAIDAGDLAGAMEIHMRDIVQIPESEVAAMFAIPEVRQHFASVAEAQIADDEAIDALGIGIDRYAAVAVPTLLIEGDASPVHLRGRVADVAAVLPNAEPVVTLAGQGHVAQMTAPDLLAGVIRRFARRILG